MFSITLKCFYQYQFLLLEGTDDEPGVQSVPKSWYDVEKECCWWPPKSKFKDISIFINLGYDPNKKTWESYPARIQQKKRYFNVFSIVTQISNIH